MITTRINPIGTEYNPYDMIVDTVEQVYGAKLRSDTEQVVIAEEGKYLDGTIVGVFIHPESDCVWAIAEYNGVYFEITFDGYTGYKGYHIKDSTELSGGVYW